MDKPNGSHEVLSARRRLLRGSFAVPAVVALHSGSALAASSNLRCVQQQAASPRYPGYTNAPDLYVRVRLHELWQGAPETSARLGWYLSGNAVEFLRYGDRQVTNALLAPGRWKQVELQGAYARLSATTLFTRPGALGNTLREGPCWVALRVLPVRNRVEIVGVVDGTSTGTAVTGSCWTSFAVM
ncbi:MAG: hypothetical protein HC793_01700 [Aquincola sp.]|nr:hypothetical protein [Aquincola sp.]